MSKSRKAKETSSDIAWNNSFKKTQKQLKKLGEEALLEYKQKKTQPLIANEPEVPFNTPKDDFWNDLSEKAKTDILDGIEQLNKGERIPYEEVMKKFRK